MLSASRHAGPALVVAIGLCMPVAPAPAAGPPTPSQYFDLSHWKLTLPVDASGGTRGVAAELQPPQLAGYASKWFRMGPGGTTLEFRAPVDGATTAGSHYPRSELREMLDPDNDNRNWHVTGASLLEAECAVSKVPSKTGKVVIGQIHGFQARPLVKLLYHYSSGRRTGSVYALVHPTPDSSTNIKLPLASGIGLNQSISYDIEADAGVLKLRVNDNGWVRYDIGRQWDSVGMYFKVGDYVQANGSRSTDGGQVGFHRFVATHPNHGLTIRTTTLGRAVPNTRYRHVLAHGGGEGAVTWSVAAGVLPAGLTLSPTGVLQGTPRPVSRTTTYHVTLLATDGKGDTAAGNYAITVAAP